MTTPSESTAGAGPKLDRATIKQIVARILSGSGLEIRELDNGLVIVNPKYPERGQVHIAYADCYVSWERVTWDYWGVLEGFQQDDDRKATYIKIIDALTTH